MLVCFLFFLKRHSTKPGVEKQFQMAKIKKSKIHLDEVKYLFFLIAKKKAKSLLEKIFKINYKKYTSTSDQDFSVTNSKH